MPSVGIWVGGMGGVGLQRDHSAAFLQDRPHNQNRKLSGAITETDQAAMPKELKSMIGTSATGYSNYSRDVPVKGKSGDMEHHHHKTYLKVNLEILQLGYKAL